MLIRLCHLADLPSPGELVAELRRSPPTAGAAAIPQQTTKAATPHLQSGALAHRIEPVMAPAPAMPAQFRDVVGLAAAAREPLLGGHLQHSVHLVRYAPPIIELRPEPAAPRDLASRLSALLLEATGVRWTIAVSNARG